MPPPGEEHVDEASAIDRAGGVKALLKQLNNKFGDSHVQLPDGTVPTKKIAIAPKKALPSAPQEGHYANGKGVSDASSPPKGVRAMLQKEVKSSFVKLPDGSTPVRKEPLSVTQKDNETQLQYAQLSSDDDYEPAPVQLDLNLQEIEYAAPPAQPAQQRDERDEYNRNSAAPPQLLEQQGSQYHQLQQPPSHLQEYQLQSSPELSDYPARANDPGVWPRGPSPPEQPVLSDYPQQQGYMQPGQPMERGHRPAGGRVSSQQIQVAASSQKLNQQDGPSAPPGSASTQRVIGPEDVYKQGSSRKVIRETVVREQRVVGEVKHKQHDKEPASKSRTEREPMGGKEVPTMHNQLPAPPPLLHGQGPQYTPNTRPGYPGGPVPTNPPNLLHEKKSPPSPGRQSPPRHTLAHSSGTDLIPSEIGNWVQGESPRQSNPKSTVKEWVQSIPSAPLSKSNTVQLSPQMIPTQPGDRQNQPPGYLPTDQSRGGFESEMTFFGEMAFDKIDFNDPVAHNAPPSTGVAPAKSQNGRFGIGVNFKRLESGCMEVMGLVPGCTGAESGLIFVGDVLRFVDGIDVTKTSGPDFEELLLGEDGSTITLSFGKPGSNTSALVHVAVNRGPDTSGSAPSDSSLSSMLTANNSAISHAAVPPAMPATPKNSLVMPRVLVPKVIHANPVNVQQLRSNRPDSVNRDFRTDSVSHDAALDSLNRESSFGPHRDEPEKLVGVGIVFNVDEWGGLRVKQLISGGPAAMSMEIVLGDVLCEIDGSDVYRKSVDEIQDVVMGPKDSVVTLGLKNPSNMGGPVRQVHLFRRFDVKAVEAAPEQPAPVSYSKVIEMLYVGDAETSRNIGLMKDLGINCVVNVALECDNFFSADFTYSNFPFEDRPSALLHNCFDEACEIIARNMHLGLTSIVHCSTGNNRSAALCVAYLMRKKRATLKQAWNLVKNVRPTINIFHAFFQQLLEYERHVHGTNTMSPADSPFVDGATLTVV